MYVRRNCQKSADNSNQVLAASLVYEETDETTHYVNLSEAGQTVLKTSTYPNYYSIGEDHTFRVGKTDMNAPLKAQITFTDLDLIAGHQLLLWPKDAKSPMQINASKVSDMSDMLVELPLMINLTSHTIVGSAPPFSGRGFSANLTAVGCGETVVVAKDKPAKVGTPIALDNITKCIWTLTTDNLNATFVNLINVTIDQGKDKVDLKKLKFYDSNSIRNNQLIQLSYFANDSFLLSSTNNLVIEYEISDKKKDQLNLTFTQAGSDGLVAAWATSLPKE